VAFRSPEALKSHYLDSDWSLTPEQDYIARAMGEEMLALLRAAASRGGLQLGTLSWIVANLEQHGFLNISPATAHRLHATVTPAGRWVLEMRPPMDADRAKEDHSAMVMERRGLQASKIDAGRRH
jgi:DNA-binding MarR family transcriptional regulator